MARLDEMRVRTPGPGGASAPAHPAAKTSRKKSDTQKRSNSRRQRGIDAHVGKLVENIPRRMRAGVTERIEVRITREETEAFTRGMDGRGEANRHDLLVTSAMSVMLRAPDGGFVVETLSPETQWILEGVERPEDQSYGRWRWAVTPTEKGQRKLQLVIGARTVDLSGMVGETALPDQVINVNVRTNYLRGIKRLLEWIVVMAAGGVVTELGVKIFHNLPKL
jgi:neural Wiskott-Aldrich syndrome protein